MNSIYKVLPLFLVTSFMISCGAKKNNTPAQKPSSGPQKYIQQASFTTLKGDTVHVSDFRGKVVVIDFWETWCKPCIGSFPTLQKLTDDYPDNLVILAVTPGFTDTPKDTRRFVAKHDYTFRYLWDSSGLSKKLGVQGIPFKVFIDPKGKLITAKMGSAGPKEDYEHIKDIVQKYEQRGS